MHPSAAPRAALRRWSYRISRLSELTFSPKEVNVTKHGIDFVSAQARWLDEHLIEIPAKTVDEPRRLVIGVIEGRHNSAVITHREGRVRIISVRWSRATEVALYEGE